jgi:D-alanyl-D-alanine carboxypeptidase/D-alanyl-D-alanine-endopeptidase (penicillin-binding protein 4)
MILLVSSVATRSPALAQEAKPASTPAPFVSPTVPSGPLPPTTASLPASVVGIPSPTILVPAVGKRGVLVETADGQVLAAESADQPFNPASAVKLATALTALRTFGPQHRFTTGVWTNGSFDRATGTIKGDLVISGRDPSFRYEDGVTLAREMNKQGIRSVSGNLIVPQGFTMNFDWSARRSGEGLHETMDSARRSPSAVRAWNDEQLALGDLQAVQNPPSVAIIGEVYVGSAPPLATLLLVHRSSKLVEILKVLLCFSNNFMAERIGDTLGGPESVRRLLINEVGIKADEVQLASTSGLGVNRVTPRAMLKIYRALRSELAAKGFSPFDILPVAGVDPGTLSKRYVFGQSRGSVIAKTGTLIRTDGGASALVGEMRTAEGQTLLFAILNLHGNVLRFRENQDQLVTLVQNSRGGPAPFAYLPSRLAMSLSDDQSDSKIPVRTDEYEP